MNFYCSQCLLYKACLLQYNVGCPTSLVLRTAGLGVSEQLPQAGGCRELRRFSDHPFHNLPKEGSSCCWVMAGMGLGSPGNILLRRCFSCRHEVPAGCQDQSFVTASTPIFVLGAVDRCRTSALACTRPRSEPCCAQVKKLQQGEGLWLEPLLPSHGKSGPKGIRLGVNRIKVGMTPGTSPQSSRDSHSVKVAREVAPLRLVA